mgnify:FL=1
MCIPSQHAQILVAADAGDFHDIETLLEQPRSGLVAQVMKPETFDAGPAYRADIGAFDSFGGEAGENVTMQTAGQGA